MTNPFMLLMAAADLGAGFWYLVHRNYVVGVSMFAFTIASVLQAFATIQ